LASAEDYSMSCPNLGDSSAHLSLRSIAHCGPQIGIFTVHVFYTFSLRSGRRLKYIRGRSGHMLNLSNSKLTTTFHHPSSLYRGGSKSAKFGLSFRPHLPFSRSCFETQKY